MVVLSGMFRVSPACPVCGAPNAACKFGDPPTATVVRDMDFTRQMDGTIVMDARYRYRLESSRWRSLLDVLVQIGDEKFERRYARGDYIPLVEALQQSLVLPSQIMEADKEDLRRHVADGKITFDQIKGALEMAKKQKKPKDRMIHAGSVVQKAMDDGAAEELLAGIE